MLYFATTGSAHITVKAHKGITIVSLRDEAAAWEALQDRFDINTEKTRRALRAQLHKKMKIGDDPTEIIATMDDLRFCLKDMGEEIFDESEAYLLLDALTPEFQFVKDKSYELGDAFDHELPTRLDTIYFINHQSRKPSTPPEAGRGAPKASTAFCTDQFHQGKVYSHFKRNCPELVKKNRPKRGRRRVRKMDEVTLRPTAQDQLPQRRVMPQTEGITTAAGKPGASCAVRPSGHKHRELSPGTRLSPSHQRLGSRLALRVLPWPRWLRLLRIRLLLLLRRHPANQRHLGLLLPSQPSQAIGSTGSLVRSWQPVPNFLWRISVVW